MAHAVWVLAPFYQLCRQHHPLTNSGWQQRPASSRSAARQLWSLPQSRSSPFVWSAQASMSFIDKFKVVNYIQYGLAC
jgi:hypothetical protein